MTSYRIKFTTPILKDIPPAEKGKRDYYYDLSEKGLMLQVTPTGAKSFYLYQRVEYRPTRMLIGPFPDLSVENARKRAREFKGRIAIGKNPQRERRAIRDEMTFKELFELYMERYSKPHKKSWKYDEREVNKHLSHLFNRKISTITRDDIFRVHANVGKNSGIYQANRILERVRGIYNKAIEWDWKGNNPADKIKKFRERSRDRFLQPDELPRFFEALEEEANDAARDFFQLCLFTGARKTNVLEMRWDQINFSSETWRIPETKNGDPQTIPLSQEALDILKARKEYVKSEWVLPSPTNNERRLNDPKKAWKRILERAEITDMRIHDLRRTFGSYQASTGANSYVIQQAMGHKSSETTKIYARLNIDPVRESINTATTAMMKFKDKK